MSGNFPSGDFPGGGFPDTNLNHGDMLEQVLVGWDNDLLIKKMVLNFENRNCIVLGKQNNY